MNSFPIEDIPGSEWQKRIQWLHDNFGPANIETWYVDIQPRIEDLVCNDKIAVMYSLRWS